MAPVEWGVVVATVIVFAYCARAVLTGGNQLRWIFILPAGLALGLLWTEAIARLLDWSDFIQMVVILSVWVGALAVRALGRHMS